MNFENVSVVIPILNEEKYIKNCLDSLLSQDYPVENLEIVLVDGMSDDSTTKIVDDYLKKYNFIKLLSDPKRTVQYALNIGMKAASGKYIVRMDAHSEYASDYISSCIKYLKDTKASNVGGPMRAFAETGRTEINADLQSAVAAAYHSDFALGGGKNHDSSYEGFADTVFLGAFKKSDIEKLGYYDERLVRNEDDDLSFRMIENGMKIFITPAIKSKYYPRSSYSDVFKQYFEYGMWKVAVIKKHKKPARISHLVPMLFVAFMTIFGILSFVSKFFLFVFGAVMALYFILDFYFSFTNKNLQNLKSKFSLMLVHFVIHFSYGLGFWAGIFKFCNTKWD